MELDNKEWQKLLDQFLIFGTIEMSLWQRANELQQYIINEIKKSANRIKNRHGNDNTTEHV